MYVVNDLDTRQTVQYVDKQAINELPVDVQRIIRTKDYKNMGLIEGDNLIKAAITRNPSIKDSDQYRIYRQEDFAKLPHTEELTRAPDGSIIYRANERSVVKRKVLRYIPNSRMPPEMVCEYFTISLAGSVGWGGISLMQRYLFQ